MTNMKPFLKRVCAYTIDLVIVLTLSSLISSIPVLNKQADEYQETYKEYEKEYTEYSEYIVSLKENYEDNEIDEEEYTKLIENETYKKIIISKYEDNEISKKEYQEIMTEINKEFDIIAKDYIYILGKKGSTNSIVTLVCTLLYFGILQYVLKGQTIGKKLLKLRVISASDKKINVLNYILRTLIVNDVLLNTIGIIFLLTASKNIYLKADNIISILVSIVEALIIFLVLTRPDGRGLHDLLFNTRVIDEKSNKENELIKIDDKKVIEVEEIDVKEESKKDG